MQNTIQTNKRSLTNKINFGTLLLIASTFLYTVYSSFDITQSKLSGELSFDVTFITTSIVVAGTFFYWSYSSYKLFLVYNDNTEDQKTYRKTALGATFSRFIPIVGIYFGYIITQEIVNNKSGLTDNRIVWLFGFQCLASLMSIFSTILPFTITTFFIDFICGTLAVLICRQTQLKVTEQL